MTRRELLAFISGILTGVVTMIVLGLWADDRNQQFYQQREERPDWAR